MVPLKNFPNISSKILTFYLQNMKTDRIFTLIAIQGVGKVEGTP